MGDATCIECDERGGYTETAASRMRRELKAVGADAPPIVVHLQVVHPYWDDRGLNWELDDDVDPDWR